MKKIILLLILANLILTSFGQNFIGSEDRPAINYFDSIVKLNTRLKPNSSLYEIINTSYAQISARPNSIITEIDNRAEKAHMTTHHILSGIIVSSYLLYCLYDSLGYNKEIAELTPVIDKYNNYLCGCTDLDDYFKSQKLNKALLKVKLDSCKKNVHSWSGWSDYKRTVDSIGKEKFSGKSQNAFIAYYIKTCRQFITLLKNDLPYTEGNSPQEIFLMKLNEFHTMMSDAVFKNITFAKSYTDKNSLDTLARFINTTRKSNLNSEKTTRMSFYNDEGVFYFLKPNSKNQMQVVSVLSYNFEYLNQQFKIRNIKYRLRKDLEGRYTNDEQIYFHMFRYPVIPLTKYGFVLQDPLPQEKRILSKYTEVLKQFDLTPPVE